MAPALVGDGRSAGEAGQLVPVASSSQGAQAATALAAIES